MTLWVEFFPYDSVRSGSKKEAERLEVQAEVLPSGIGFLNLTNGMEVLDAGCGSGALTIELANRVGPAGHATGIDSDAKMVKAAEGLAHRRNTTNVKFQHGDLLDLEYQESRFDLCYSRLVFQHLQLPVKALSELERITKKGGSVAVWDIDDGGILLFPDTKVVKEAWMNLDEWAKSVGTDRFVGGKLLSMFIKAGFKQELIEVIPDPIIARSRSPGVSDALAVILQQQGEKAVKGGYMSSTSLELALREMRNFRETPGALMVVPAFMTIGKKDGED